MAVRIKFDNTHNVISPTFVLATRSGRKLGCIQADHIVVSDAFNSRFDLTFQVSREYDGVKTPLWDSIVDFKLIWCREWDVWFEIYVSTKDDNETIKYITCVSLGEAELSQIILNSIEINTEDDIAREDYKPTILFNEKDHTASLLHRIMEKCPHYSIKYVSPSIADIQRTFQFDGESVYDALQKISEEIDCLVVINSGSEDDGSISRSISLYDLESYCVSCGKRGNFQEHCPGCGRTDIIRGYGDDTSIFVSTENLANDVNVKVDTDSVKNCFRLVAGDDLMTAVVMNCNPNGSQYIWYISDESKADMSAPLVDALRRYDSQYDYYLNDYSYEISVVLKDRYNTLVSKYRPYNSDIKELPAQIKGYPALMNTYFDTIDFSIYLKDGMMPSPKLDSTTASNQVALLTSESLSPIAVSNLKICSAATASNIALSVAKTIVDQRYRVKVKDGSYADGEWTGKFVVTNYADEKDSAESGTIKVIVNDDYERFVKQKIDNVLRDSERQNHTAGISELFKLDNSSFESELKKYCLNSLNIFHDCCQSCLDILIKQGIADKKTWANKTPDLYSEIYLPFYEKLEIISRESMIREDELHTIVGKFDEDGSLLSDGVQTVLERERDQIQSALDMEAFIGNDLWLELVSYRREDTYTNENFISDGLTNAELFKNAMEFVETAKKEIFKSATQQHTLSATLKNLLVMEEFLPIVDRFAVGNWIRVKIDGIVYRLRLLRYQIDFDNLDNIQVEFSDVKKFSDGVSDAQDIFSQASSMASSYGTVSRQASQGSKGHKQINEWVDKGLALTKMKIVDNASNQNIIWDSHGLLCREKVFELDRYSDKQLKIINRGLYLTDDNWKTSKAGIGDFVFYNPSTGKVEESYGVIADTLVGNLILSEEVGVYAKDNSIVLGEKGLVITTDKLVGGSTGDPLFTIQKNETDADGHVNTKRLLYLNDKGNLVINGSVQITSDSDGSDSLGGTLNGINNAVSQNAEAISQIKIDANNVNVKVESSVNKITILYALGNSYSEPPQTGWEVIAPENDGTKYLWQKTITAKNNGDIEESVSCIQSPAASGGDGKTSYIHIKYSDDGGITFTPADPDKHMAEGETPGKYIGQYTSFSATDSTNPKDYQWALMRGNDGAGVDSVVTQYAVSDQGKTPPSTGWQDAIPDVTDGQFLWVKTVISYTDGREPTTSYSINRNGTDGSNGNGIEKAIVSYAVSDNGATPPLEGWQPEIPVLQEGQYLWTKIILSYTDGTQSDPSYSVSRNGKDGEQGAGVKNASPQYYFSTSETSLEGGEWSDTSDGWTSGLYVWTREKSVLTDGSIIYSEPIYNKTITDALNGAKENSDRLTVLDKTVSDLSVTSQNISASVQELKKTTDANNSSIHDDLLEIKKSVESKMTSEEVKLEIKKEVSNGAVSVKTETGFVFDQAGLNISKSDSEMNTKITEDGMRISRGGSEVLKADNQGVDAENLHATTYLIVGQNSRFEDYGPDRTGCFWIG